MDSYLVKGPSDDLVPVTRTFFLLPDPTLINDIFLEVAFLRGFECYPIPGLIGADHQEIVEAITRTFHSSVLFFFIEKDESIDHFSKLVEGFQNRYGNSVRLGVFYQKRTSEQEDQDLQTSFLYDIGIEAGCVSLTNSALSNHERILNVLAANEVEGRRSVIRMPTQAHIRIELVLKDSIVETTLLDLSVTHFTIELESLAPNWKIGTKLTNIRFHFGELMILARGLITLKRIVKGKVVFVIRFHSAEGTDERLASVVNRIIYRFYQKRTMELINLRLDEIRKRL